MTRNGLGPLALLALTLALTLAASPVWADPDSPRSAVGNKVANVALTGLDGKAVNLHDLKDRDAIVVVFLSFDCPVSRSYTASLAEMAKAYGPRKVAFLGVCPGDEELAVLAKHAEEFALGFPVYRDDKLQAADACHARAVPEAFVLDRDLVMRYRGRIDDTYSDRFKKNPKVTHNDLR